MKTSFTVVTARPAPIDDLEPCVEKNVVIVGFAKCIEIILKFAITNCKSGQVKFRQPL